MALSTPVDREFQVLSRGFLRDKVVLANFREGLRALVNPETGNPFTADEIQRATQPGSRWYVAAQAIDDYGQGEQRKALWLADQIRIERASTKWLEGYHARLWGEEKLAATGGAGPVTVTGTAGTIVLGSTELGAPGAYTARDAAGNVYQVLTVGTIDADGSTPFTMQAVSTGEATNPPAGEVLTWITRDPNMAPAAIVASNFTGGLARETDAEQAARIAGVIRHRPGGGNSSQVRAWARASTNAIEEAFVYPCPFYAGSTLVAILQKRGTTRGPAGRQPNVTVLATAISYLTPPASPVFPPRGFVVVTGFNAQPSHISLQLGMQKASLNGWVDARPFPAFHATTPFVQAVTDQTHFVISCPGDAALPGQEPLATLLNAAAPQMMLWNEPTSEFAQLSISEVEDLGSGLFAVELSAPPQVASGAMTVAVGQTVSPAMPATRAKIVADTAQEYFDSLGTSELFDLATDSRGGRCVRFPKMLEEKPARSGAVVATRVIEALGGVSADGILASMSVTQPSYPTNLALGPSMIVCGRVGVYDLP